jgi:hypothetical protein
MHSRVALLQAGIEGGMAFSPEALAKVGPRRCVRASVARTRVRLTLLRALLSTAAARRLGN